MMFLEVFSVLCKFSRQKSQPRCVKNSAIDWSKNSRDSCPTSSVSTLKSSPHRACQWRKNELCKQGVHSRWSCHLSPKIYSQTGCSLAGHIAMLRCNVAILTSKLLVANCNRFDKLPVDRYCSFQCLLQNKGKFVSQACNICILKHFKLILNVFLPVRRLERELVYYYTFKFV